VQVTFDAIPGLERAGTVLSVAASGVNISGVTNYYATVLLTQTYPRLKDGLTAEVTVTTSSLNNVLVVPNSAVIRAGDQTFVNVVGPNGQPERLPFRPGAVGDDNTQVLSGLQPGQRILQPRNGTPPAGQPGGTHHGPNGGTG
jgi:multidrug efflux pump subunit AcrA (membrane-fusion protein)